MAALPTLHLGGPQEVEKRLKRGMGGTGGPGRPTRRSETRIKGRRIPGRMAAGPWKAAKSSMLYRLPRMCATPRNHECVRGTVTVVGTGITSFTWCSATNQFSAPTWKPSFEASAARVEAVRMRSATESWNSRSPVRRAMEPSPAP